MRLNGDITAITCPGQFINIRLDGHYLRRPISVNDVTEPDKNGCGTVTIIYKVLGHGTEEMTHMEPGKELDILTGLGNGYDLGEAGPRPLLIGGGVGIPPLYLAARRLTERARSDKARANVTVVLGFNSADEVYYVEEFTALGCTVVTATADGSTGIRGFVTDAVRELSDDGKKFTHFYTCGPEPMLKAVYGLLYRELNIPGQMSFEERMGCGFGACMGCSCRTVTGYKRICKDGPVLRTEEILWQ
jgi:dihydroorotate dehydrogenase electron transfer subunit